MSAVSRYYPELFKRDKKRNFRRNEGLSEKVNWPLMFLSVLLVGLVLILIIYLCECAQVVNSQYQICRLKETKNALVCRIDKLEIKIQNLSSLDRINKMARKELGMVDAQQKIVLQLAKAASSHRSDYYGFAKILQPR